MTRQEHNYPWLVADIGGTNARFGLVIDAHHQIEHVISLRCADYPSLEAATQHYFAQVAHLQKDPQRFPGKAAFAIATAIHEDTFKLTNSPWIISKKNLAQALRLAEVQWLNDFEALALSLPHLNATNDLQFISNKGRSDSYVAAINYGLPMAVIGPGTGLGVAACIPTAHGWTALASEGGHVTLSAFDDFESDVLRAARAVYPHVSAERLLSGLGLPALYQAVATALGKTVAAVDTEGITAAQITQGAISGSDTLCRATVDCFCGLLGSFAGNVALTLGARGGVFIAGGVAEHLRLYLANSNFRSRFESKGRFAEYLKTIATSQITNPKAALIGATHALTSKQK